MFDLIHVQISCVLMNFVDHGDGFGMNILVAAIGVGTSEDERSKKGLIRYLTKF